MRMGMVQLFVINLTNIGLNVLFVVGLDMDVTGVALASVIAQWVGLAVILWIIFRHRRRFQLKVIELSRNYLSTKPRWLAFVSVSRDLFFRTVMLWMVEAILLAEAAKTGDVKLASMQIILNIFGFISFGLDGFAHTAEAMVGDRQGKGAFWDMKVVIWRNTQ